MTLVPRRLAAIAAFLSIAPGAVAQPDAGYAPSPAQARVDRSMSDIPIATPLDRIRTRLTEQQIGDCRTQGECEWQDAEGVRYAFWADEPFAFVVVDKIVLAEDFEGQPIAALGIGLARERGAVLAAATRFVPEAAFECREWRHDTQWETCQATLSPGSVTLEFDRRGALVRVQLTGYHYT